MAWLRTILLAHRHMTLAIILMAIAVRALIPSGMMVSAGAPMTLTVTVCTGMGEDRTIAIAVERQAPAPHDSRTDAQPCGFASLGFGALPAVDPLPLALAIAFIVLAGFAAFPPFWIGQSARLWPPMRGPPGTA